MVKVLKMLAESTDEIDREMLRTLRAWQDAKAAAGGNRSLGREPGQIAKSGSVAVIESRILRSSVGFDEVGSEESYEAIADRHPNRFSHEVVELARKRLLPARQQS